MSSNASSATPNYGFPIFSDSDKPSWLVDWNGTMDSLDTGLTQLKTQIEANENLVTNADAEIAKIKTNITEIESSIETLINRVTEDEGDIKTLQSRYNSVINDLQVQNKLILQLQEKVNELESEVESNTTDISNLKATTKKNTEDITSIAGIANTASTKADNATEVANTASQTANVASQTADSASQTADSASQTANAASQTANAASQTANTASETASNAISKVTNLCNIMYCKGGNTDSFDNIKTVSDNRRLTRILFLAYLIPDSTGESADEVVIFEGTTPTSDGVSTIANKNLNTGSITCRQTNENKLNCTLLNASTQEIDYVIAIFLP